MDGITQQNVEDLVARIDENQLVQFVSWAGLLLELADAGGKDIDKALVVDKNICEMSSVDVEVVMVEVVKIAGKFELGPECENGMWDRLKSVVCNPKLQWQEDKINQWESQLLEFFDFAISRKHLLHFLHIFWLLMGDVRSGNEKENGWASVKGLSYIAMAKAPLMNNNPSLVAAALMRIALHLFLNRRQLPEDKFPKSACAFYTKKVNTCRSTQVF